MYIESILQQIDHAVEDVEFIMKDDNDGIIGVDVALTDGVIFGVTFRDEEERGLFWNELSETPPVPFVGIGNSFVRVKYLRDVKIDKLQENVPAIILGFTSPAKIIKPYNNAATLERDYFALVQILSQYQDKCSNVFFRTIEQ